MARLGDLVPDLARHANPCWRKARQTRGKAEAQLRSILLSARVEDAEHLSFYHCPHCGNGCTRPNKCEHWHIGRKRKTNKEER
jgi:hypothetical protein